MQQPRRLVRALQQNIAQVVVGKDDVIELALIALLCKGHILIEDVPGVGKTTLASALARSLDCSFKRIQFTPDITPSDITGFSIVNFKTGELEYRPGLVMSQIVLADEINRTSPRTQSSLLEVMEEGQVTVDGVTHAVPQPFVVIATQNPVGASGTQLLPDSQMDRFMVRLSIGYPRAEDEREMLRRRQGAVNPLDSVREVVGPGGLMAMRERVDAVFVDDAVLDYIIRLNGGTRAHPKVMQGASPRASLAVTAMARAVAYVQGRDYVLPADVKLIYRETVAHRLLLTPEAESAGATATAVLDELLKSTSAPRIA